jgi:hypothetical protein
MDKVLINRRNLLLTLIPLFWILCKDYEGVNGDTKTFVKQYNIWINYLVEAFGLLVNI